MLYLHRRRFSYRKLYTQQIIPTCLIGGLDNLIAHGYVVGFDKGINGFLYKVSFQLCLCQETPDCRVITRLCKFRGTIKVMHLVDQHLQ